MACAVGEILGFIGSRLFDTAVREAGYLAAVESNVQSLDKGMAELEGVRSGVQRRVDMAERLQLDRTGPVKAWLESVEKIRVTVSDIDKGLLHIQRTSPGGCALCSWWASYKLSRSAVKTLADAQELKDKGNFDAVADKSLPVPVLEISCQPTVGLEQVLKTLMECYVLDQADVIGIHGIGGVGKTALLKSFNNMFLCEGVHDLDVVIFVKENDVGSVEKMQKTVQDRLGTPWEDGKKSEDRAAEICSVLSKLKFMVLLDGIWDRVDLADVGIPLPDKKHRRKIVFSTRQERVCYDMDAQEIIRLECLGSDDAWELFKRKVGEETLNAHPRILELANQIMKQYCSGLPLAIVTFGGAMAGKRTPNEWEDLARAANNSTARVPGLNEALLATLEFSYKKLRDNAMRDCFLYCALFPVDHSIRKADLVDYYNGEGFLGEIDDVAAARNKGHEIIGGLKSASMLEDGDNKEREVKMHGSLRALALWLTSTNGKAKKLQVHAGGRLRRAPAMDGWIEAERVSLMQNDIKELVQPPNSPNLRALLVNDNPNLRKISESYFVSMPELLVLDLSHTAVEELPKSIGELVNLRYLNLAFTKLSSLPSEARKLAKLKHLNLEGTISLAKIPAEVISSLLLLQVLNLYDSYSDWEATGSDGEGGGSSLKQLERLQKLSALGITITSTLTLGKFVNADTLDQCTSHLLLRDCRGLASIDLSQTLGDVRNLKELSIYACSDLKELILNETECGGAGLEVLLLSGLSKADIFWRSARNPDRGALRSLRTVTVNYCHALKDLTWVLLLPCLELVFLSHCNEVQHLVEGGEEGAGKAFPRLKKLTLKSLPKLQGICSFPLGFPALEQLEVLGCPKLQKLPLGENSAKKLVALRGEKEWWDALQWDNDAVKSSLSRFMPK